MKSLVLKVDVDTLRGTLEGVPQLVQLFKKHNVQASFLFSLGPDNTGRAIKRVFRPGFFSKVKRTSVLSHYGLKTLLYGTLLPGPSIAKNARQEMKAVMDAGFEVGIHTYDHVYWQDNVFRKDLNWTHDLMERSRKAYLEVFEQEPSTHGAAGWQMNDFAFEWLERFSYASDTRGKFPFYPIINGKTLKCVQLPTTLPTMDELIGTDDITESNIADFLLKKTEMEPALGHVFTLHAELEGMKLLPAMDKFLTGLKKQGYTLINMHQLYDSIKATKIPACEIQYSEIEGRSGSLFQQGESTTQL